MELKVDFNQLFEVADTDAHHEEPGYDPGHVIVDTRVISFAGEFEREFWPAEPYWFEYGNSLEDIFHDEFERTHDGFGAVRSGLIPGDVARFRVYRPRWSTDYWGETDMDQEWELIDVYQGVKSQHARIWSAARAFEDMAEYEAGRRQQKLAMARVMRRHREFWGVRTCNTHGDSAYASLVFVWPKRLRLTYGAQTVVTDKDGKSMQVYGTHQSNAQKLRELVCTSLNVTPEYFDSIPALHNLWW